MENLRAWGLILIVAFILYALIAWIFNADRPWDITAAIWNYIFLVIIVATLRGIVTGQYPGLKKENLKANLKEWSPIPIAVFILWVLIAAIIPDHITTGWFTLSYIIMVGLVSCLWGVGKAGQGRDWRD